jgi:hypothetical protein
VGADIASACGQLVVKKEKEEAMANVDIEDGPFTVSPKAEKRSVSVSKSAKGTHAGEPDANDASKWIKPLAIATSVAASCFVASSILFLSQKRRR